MHQVCRRRSGTLMQTQTPPETTEQSTDRAIGMCLSDEGLSYSFVSAPQVRNAQPTDTTMLLCKRCGTPMFKRSNADYHIGCAKIVTREKTAARQRKLRELHPERGPQGQPARSGDDRPTTRDLSRRLPYLYGRSLSVGARSQPRDGPVPGLALPGVQCEP